MGGQANLANDAWFLGLVQSGNLKVFRSGRIKNTKTGRWLRGVDSNGYLKISYQDPKTKRIRQMQTHRLVWITFNGPLTNSKTQVNHEDGNKQNPSLSNLNLKSNSGNMRHALRRGLLSPNRGVENGQAKLTPELVKRIRKFASCGLGSKRIAKKLDSIVSYGTIQSVLDGKTWTHV